MAMSIDEHRESTCVTQYRALLFSLANGERGIDDLNGVLAEWAHAGWDLHSHSLSMSAGIDRAAAIMVVFSRSVPPTSVETHRQSSQAADSTIGVAQDRDAAQEVLTPPPATPRRPATSDGPMSA